MVQPEYPGAPEQQALLRAIVEQYADDERVLAVSVFGSLGRGTWDEYSDLDLDVVTVDGLKLDAMAEVRQLCEAIGQEPVVLLPYGDDAADVVLASLMELSIRYHPLATTKVNIVNSLRVLGGRLNYTTIAAAGLANPARYQPSVAEAVGACVRHAVTTDAKLHRRAFWLAFLVLSELREAVFRLYAMTHGGGRPYHAVDASADEALQARFGATLPRADLPSLQRALLTLLDLLEHDLETLSDGQARLTDGQREVLVQLRARQAKLDLRGERRT
jgi:predicted nucleotidyltransferase